MAKFGKYTLHLFITTHSLRRMMKKFDLFFEIDKHTSNSEKKNPIFEEGLYWKWFNWHILRLSTARVSNIFKRKFEIHIKGWNIKVICQDNTSLSRYIVIWKTRIDGWYIHTVLTYGCLWLQLKGLRSFRLSKCFVLF